MAKALRTSLRYGGLRQGGLQSGLGNDDIFATASLDLNFAVNKNLGTLVDATTGTNLIDFTRASSGTYVGSDGLIKKATTNLLSWSEDFTNAAWQTTNPGEVTVIPGVADPFGGTNGTTLFHDSGAGDTGWLRRLNSGTIGLSYRFSFWIRRRSGSGDFFVVLGDNINQTISGITSEWQRVSVSNTPTSTTLRTYFKVDSAGDQFDVFGAQLEQSSTVGEYVKTTSTINSAPRFNHDPTTGESLGLLVEESRTNTILQSNQFNTTWNLGTGNPTVSLVTHTAPDGSTQSWKLTEGTSNGGQDVWQAGVSNSSGLSVYSVYAKAAERYKIALRESTTLGAVGLFDLSAGTLVAVAGGGTPSPVGIITPVGNGWYRCSLLFNQGTTANRSFRIFVVEDSETSVGGAVASRTGDGVSGVYIYGAQLEAGSFPTSYIPTTTAAVTRAADVAGIYDDNFSSWYRQDEGTVFASIVGFPITSGQFPRIYEINDGTSNNVIRSQEYGSNTIRNNIVSGGTTYMAQDGGTIAEGSKGKTAFAVAENNCAIVTNGGVFAIDNTVTIPNNLNQMLILGTSTGTSSANSTISRLTFWPTRLSNETLSTITQ